MMAIDRDNVLDVLMGLLEEEPEPPPKEPPLTHKIINFPLISGGSISFTGTLDKYSRGQANASSIAAGLVPTKTINSKLNYFVVGHTTNSASKEQKARNMGAYILTEDDFENLLVLLGKKS